MSASDQKHAKATLLIDVTLRDFITRSQLWKYHVANTSLKWIVSKVSYADGLTASFKDKGGAQLTMAMGVVDQHGVAVSGGSSSGSGGGGLKDHLASFMAAAPSSNAAVKGPSSAAPAGQKRSREAADSSDSEDEHGAVGSKNAASSSSYAANPLARFMAELDGATFEDGSASDSSNTVTASKAKANNKAAQHSSSSEKKADASSQHAAAESAFVSLYSNDFATTSSSHGGDMNSTQVDKPIHKAPHLVYLATFYEQTSGAAAVGLSSGNAYKTNELLNGTIKLRPELFLCLLLRALQLSKEIHSLHIVEMVEQNNAPNTVRIESKKSGATATTTTVINMNGSKYLRVFGLFLARMLLAYRNEPALLKRCFDAAKTDVRKVRVMRRIPVKDLGMGVSHTIDGKEGTQQPQHFASFGGGDAENPVSIMRVDEVAHLLMTTDRWDRIAFPSCKAL